MSYLVYGTVPYDRLKRHCLLGICGHRRGAIVTTFIVCYAFTSFISGYVGGGFYSRNDGKPMSSFDISIESLIK
jgi:hypothetical protein